MKSEDEAKVKWPMASKAGYKKKECLWTNTCRGWGMPCAS